MSLGVRHNGRALLARICHTILVRAGLGLRVGGRVGRAEVRGRVMVVEKPRG